MQAVDAIYDELCRQIVRLELKVVLSKVPSLDNKEGLEVAKNMISVANLSRQGFANGDISTLMSPGYKKHTS